MGLERKIAWAGLGGPALGLMMWGASGLGIVPPHFAYYFAVIVGGIGVILSGALWLHIGWVWLRTRKSTRTDTTQIDGVRLISLQEAATQAYERTLGTTVAGFAERASSVLSWYAYALIGQKFDLPVFGIRAPSRIMERIPENIMRQGSLSDDATGLMLGLPRKKVYCDLSIPAAALDGRIAEIRRWVADLSE